MAQFQHGLCACFDDIGLCCITWFLPCLTSGQNAEAMGENCLLYGIGSITCVGPVTNGMIRQKVREKYGIDGSFLMDIACHLCCPLCAIIQDAQEIRAHGGSPGGMAMARE